MARLSDRAFKVIELEIDDLHNRGVIDKLDSIILVSRLCTLRAEAGKHLTRTQVWDNLCDVVPDIDPKVLTSAAASNKGLSDVRISVGVGATAVLVASTFGMKATTASVDISALSSTLPVADVSQDAAQGNQKDGNRAEGRVESRTGSRAANPIMKRLSLKARFTRTGEKASESAAFIQAKDLGWQAALKGKNPPHSAQHWRETAALWQQAIVYLHQVPKRAANYEVVEAKIAFYEKNLEEIEGRWAVAIARENSPQVMNPAPSTQVNVPQFSSTVADDLAIARRHGWQASLASQNAPHPARKWADISRHWRTALQHIDQVPAESAQYAEAQQVKAIYQKNLAAVRQRYLQEQAASQSVASLQAALGEIKRSGLSHQAQAQQQQAILNRLSAIPVGTDAHSQAQRAIAQISASSDEKIAASY